MNDRMAAGRRLLEHGSFALRVRDVARARQAFEGALTVFAGPDVGLARGHALRGLGEIAALEQDAPRADRLLQHAITEYRWFVTLADELIVDPELRESAKETAVEGEAITRVLQANPALSRGDVRAAEAHVDGAYPLFRKLGKPPSISNLWDATARVAFWEGRLQAAIRAWERAIQVLEERGDPRGSCLTGVRLAEAYLAVGRLEAAEERLTQADVVARELEEPGIRGRVFAGWGAWYARRDSFEAALDAYEDALTCFREVQDRELELRTVLRMARVASRSGRVEVVPRLREALALLEQAEHSSALGTLLAVLAEHALEVGKPEVALVAVASAVRFWGDREPLEGRQPLLRLEIRALAGVGATRAAITVVHHLAMLAGDRQPALLKLREAWRRRAADGWLAQIDGLAPSVLAGQADSMLEVAVTPWCARLSVPVDRLGTAHAASVLCDRLQSEVAAVVAVDDRALQEVRPSLIWESGASERQETALSEGVTAVGRGPDNDVALPWDDDLDILHLTLHREGGEVRLVDMGSGSGTFVDGQRVDEVVLTGGERIRVGGTVFRFQLRQGARGETPSPIPLHVGGEHGRLASR